jgi:hypothetical protein
MGASVSRCWAHAPDGQRCELDASDHDLHQITMTWTDDEVWHPDKADLPEVPDPVLRAVRGDDRNPITDHLTCMVCDHPNHGDSECLVLFQGAECGCYRAVV